MCSPMGRSMILSWPKTDNLYFSSPAGLRLRESIITNVQVLVHVQLTGSLHKRERILQIYCIMARSFLWSSSCKIITTGVILQWQGMGKLCHIVHNTRIFQPQKICVTKPTGFVPVTPNTPSSAHASPKSNSRFQPQDLLRVLRSRE